MIATSFRYGATDDGLLAALSASIFLLIDPQSRTLAKVINNMCFPSTVCSSYAPVGKDLVSVTLIGRYSASSDAEREEWTGRETVAKWQHLKTYRILFAQPDQTPPTNLSKEPKVDAGLYLCGDHRVSATFDGALLSGRRAAEALLSDSELKVKGK
ncbi:uncharacterized protein LOC112340526 [Selaginella moellendorffii]|uniref:uncharacterized protein LOC112340526 n=1 Tax=Selaginella moellendorffii TaxID=88036 RepID=UPI000D1C9F9D|nr:uncharacterized protein LOC112340526 [Selaginella moellendorffii]|eukprot:XP_024514865.1 uncharacterized protein LOC112340526 [Selaginella moellendorffii]